METGTINYFDKVRGTGLLTIKSSGKQIPFHQSGLKDNIRENDTVSFDLEDGKKGQMAINIKLA